MDTPRSEVYGAIDAERAYQKGWEDPTLTTSGGRHTNVEYLAFIQDYVREALQVCTRQPDPKALVFSRHSLRKIAALAVAAMEQNGIEVRSPEDILKQRHQ